MGVTPGGRSRCKSRSGPSPSMGEIYNPDVGVRLLSTSLHTGTNLRENADVLHKNLLSLVSKLRLPLEVNANQRAVQESGPITTGQNGCYQFCWQPEASTTSSYSWRSYLWSLPLD